MADLLKLACDRIADLDRPAYIKDHMLRYVSVNDAYARLFGLPATRFAGLPSRGEVDANRERLEQNALLTDGEKTFHTRPAHASMGVDFHVERFITEAGAAYLYGYADEASDGVVPSEATTLETLAVLLDGLDEPLRLTAGDGRTVLENAAWRRQTPVAIGDIAPLPVTQTSSQAVEKALEMLDVGIGVFDADNRLIYRNHHLERLYSPFVGPMEPGFALRDLYGRIHDHGTRHYPKETLATLPAREEWVAERLANFTADFFEATELSCDGRWLRSLNRRLPNGMLLMVRLDVTDLKSQELLLRRQVDEIELYHSIIEELPVAVFARGGDHRMVFANAAYCTLFGLEREAVIGRTEIESYGEEGRPFYNSNDRVLAGGGSDSIEETLIDSTGKRVEAMTRVSRVLTEQGERYVVGSIVDITELKSREEALREAQGRSESLSHDLSGILSALPAGVLVFDDHLMVEYVNNPFFDVCGLARDTVLHGRPVHHAIESIYYHAEWEEGANVDLPEKLSLLFERGSEATLEFLTREGKAVIAASRNLSGGKTLVTFADISALRQHEREINETQKQLENIGQFMQDAARVMSQGLFVVEDGVIILSNSASADIMCLPPELVAPGQPWTNSFAYCIERGDFGPDADARALASGWEKSLRESGTLAASFMADGKSWVQFVATLSERGHVTIVFNDLTDMKHREEELERLLARSEAADRAKTEFLANMGHEIRTPMNGVLGMAELLAKTDLDARQRTFTEIITKSATALLTIFNDILDFSKIDAGRMELKSAPFDPVEALEDVCALHSAAASEKNIELLVRFASPLPKRVIGDAGRFRQIVSNFVSNAIRHTEHGHVLAEMSAAPSGDGRHLMTVRVVDTGAGLQPQKLKSIFEKFSQPGLSESRNSEGTGLGLAITSGLVALFGGTLDVESAPGQGSTFAVHLPMAVVDVADTTRPVPVHVRGSRILVVDDNEISRAILTSHLEGWGFDCCAADSAESALAILSAARDMAVPVDMLLVDYHMVQMEGAEFCREIRSDPANDGVALTLLTSLDAASEMSLFESLRVQAHLTKPVRANILRNTVIEVLRARHQRRQAGDSLETLNAFAARLPSISLDLPDAGDLFEPPSVEQRVRVVVAEDNEVNAIVFSQMLAAAGHAFALAANGEEAIALWQKHQPDVILMDVSMPVMDGLEAARRIRHMERVADMQPVPIIAVTSHDTQAGRDLCLNHGMDDYLAKPISPEMLEAKLDRWLNGPDRAEMPAE